MKKQLLVIALFTVLLLGFSPRSAQAGWVGTSAGMTYQTGSGKATGLVRIDNATYFFNRDGIMQTGVQRWNKELYFFSLMTGKMLYGWIRSGALTYYANEQTGALYRNRSLGSYYFQSDGTLAGGGVGGSKTTGWVKRKGKKYYYDETGTLVTGLATINGKKYVFNSRGVLQTERWVKVDGVSYYAGKKGYLWISKWVKKKVYYVTESGARASGFTTIGKKLYYFDSRTGKMKSGRFKVDESYYVANDKGAIYRGKFFKYKGKRYYAQSDGTLAVGLEHIGANIYFFKSKGTMVTEKRKSVDGATYYFQKSGRAARNKWVRIKKKYYYFLDDGTMAVNQFIGSTYYVGADGVRVKKARTASGLTLIKGKYYIVDANGKAILNQFVIVSKKTYYTGADGAVLTGLQTIGTKQYYFDSDGVMQADTIVVVGKKAYTLSADGHVTKVSEFTGDVIAAYGQKFVGNPYVYGGTSLTKGADCSGFVLSVFAKFGIKMLRVANDQMNGPSSAQQTQGYKKGVQVSRGNLAPGDLVFYGSSGYASHVAIYIGNGKVVHAANSRVGIVVTSMTWTGTPIKYMRYWA